MSRIDRAEFTDLAPGVVAGFRAVSKAVSESGLDHGLIELIKVRASQINGCAFCVEMHIDEARKAGISDKKLHLVAVWSEAHSVFSDDERAALAWTEALTTLAGNEITDTLYETVRARFDEKQIANLTAAIALINAWNRIAKPLEYSLSGTLEKS